MAATSCRHHCAPQITDMFSMNVSSVYESSLTEGVLKAVWTTKLKISAAFLIATVAATGGRLPAQQALAPPAAKPDSLAAVPGAKAKPADSARWAQTEAKLARLREITKPQPGEYVTNMAKIAWERDPWEAAIKAAREGKPVLAYGPGMVGVPCGYG
jgi:hypothetical protein